MPKLPERPACILDDYDPPELFRYFDEEAHAAAMCRGEIYLTTLATCRAHEATRCDPEEATEFYNTGAITGDGTDPRFQYAARSFGAMIHPSVANTTFINCTRTTRVADALLLCLSDAPRLSKFGRYGVRIRDPKTVFVNLHHALTTRGLAYSGFGRVTYRTRQYRGSEAAPGFVGFVKPPRFSEEREARMLFVFARSWELKPITVTFPELGQFCSRL